MIRPGGAARVTPVPGCVFGGTGVTDARGPAPMGRLVVDPLATGELPDVTAGRPCVGEAGATATRVTAVCELGGGPTLVTALYGSSAGGSGAGGGAGARGTTLRVAIELRAASIVRCTSVFDFGRGAASGARVGSCVRGSGFATGGAPGKGGGLAPGSTVRVLGDAAIGCGTAARGAGGGGGGAAAACVGAGGSAVGTRSAGTRSRRFGCERDTGAGTGTAAACSASSAAARARAIAICHSHSSSSSSPPSSEDFSTGAGGAVIAAA